MAKKSKLLAALDAHKGRDYDAEKKKKQLKAGEKRKRQKEEANQDGSSDDEEKVEKPKKTQTAASKKLNGILKPVKQAAVSKDIEEDEEEDTDSEAADEAANGTTIPQPTEPAEASASEAEPESDVPVSDLEAEDLEDTVPHQRLTINNGPALTASTRRVTVAQPQMPFHQHNSLVSTLPASAETIPDPNDDLTRELEFYRIAREATVAARALLKKEKVPFTRPVDYFAEMVKSDEHMGKVKKKMYDEAAGKKASEEAKKLRDAKKFGKAVQMAKEQERSKEKRDTLDKIKELKRKRRGQASENVTEGDDLFQEISVENGPNKDRSGRDRGGGGGGGGGPHAKRQKRDSKYGFGGKKRFSKSGDAVSSADMSGFSASRMKGKGGRPGKRITTKRLGKSKRAARS